MCIRHVVSLDSAQSPSIISVQTSTTATFNEQTQMGGVMEPVTYLSCLTMVIMGYLWYASIRCPLFVCLTAC